MWHHSGEQSDSQWSPLKVVQSRQNIKWHFRRKPKSSLKVDWTNISEHWRKESHNPDQMQPGAQNCDNCGFRKNLAAKDGLWRLVTNVVATGLGRLCPRLIYGRQPLHSYIKIFHRRDIGACPTWYIIWYDVIWYIICPTWYISPKRHFGACPTWYIQEIPAEGLSGCQQSYVTKFLTEAIIGQNWCFLHNVETSLLIHASFHYSVTSLLRWHRTYDLASQSISQKSS